MEEILIMIAAALVLKPKMQTQAAVTQPAQQTFVDADSSNPVAQVSPSDYYITPPFSPQIIESSQPIKEPGPTPPIQITDTEAWG